MSTTFEVYRSPILGRYYDPFKLLASLQHYAGGGKKFNELVAKQADPTALLQLAAAGRKALDLPPVDAKTGQGFPDPVVLQAVEEFTEYVKGKGSGAGGWRSWLPSPASPPRSAPKNCSDCG